jgi:cytochrome P450
VLSRHPDVLAALHASSLIPGRRDLADVSVDSEETARLRMREEVRSALSAVPMRAWRERLKSGCEELSQQLSLTEPVDLVTSYGRPLCLLFAAMVTGIDQNDANSLEGLAQVASAATAEPENLALQAPAKEANATLGSYFNAGPEPLRSSGFVGLSQTLLRIVSAAWYALIQNPHEWFLLRNSPQSVHQAIEELLRYAGVVRLLTRTATDDIQIGGASIRKGDRVLLRTFAASNDPSRFSDPRKLDCTRRDPGHFTFGAGGHSCIAANLIRTAAITMTLPLLARFDSVQLAQSVEWHGGSIMRSPVALWVTLGVGNEAR